MLIASASSKLEQRWDPWLDNLANWFPGIPNGPILLGCRRAEQAGDHAVPLNCGKPERWSRVGYDRDALERASPVIHERLPHIEDCDGALKPRWIADKS